MTTPLETALTIAALGLPVFPTREATSDSGTVKAPYTRHGFTDVTTDPNMIRAWWRTWPNAMPAIATGAAGLVVVDVDCKGGKQGLENWRGICERLQLDLSGWVIVRTPSGGLHNIFRQREQRIGCSNGKIADGIDIKGDGGYVVAAGAIMADGGAYVLADGHLESIPLIPESLHMYLIETMPSNSAALSAQDHIFTQTRRPPSEGEIAFARKALEVSVADLRATKGNRNDALNGSAYRLGRMVGSGWLNLQETANALQQAADENGYIDKDGIKVTRATIISGLTAGMKDPRIEMDTEDDQPPIPLPDTLPSVEPFDLKFLPDVFQPWAADVAERMQCPIDFIAIAIITAASAAIGRRIGIRPKPDDDWIVIPNLWGLAIARPGMMKSPAIAEAMKPLKRLEAKERDRHRERMKAYNNDMRSYRLLKSAAEKKLKKELDNGENADIIKGLPAEPVEPRPTRYIVGDSTYEALGDLLSHNPFGVLVHRDEIMGLLKMLDREENAASKAFYLSAWAGNEGYTFDRIMRGYQHIDAVCIALLGTTQPGKITEYVGRAIRGGGSDDGMIQRFNLMIWPDIPKTWKDVKRGPDREAFRRVDETFDRLISHVAFQDGKQLDAQNRIPCLTFNALAAEVFIDWQGQLETRLRSGELHPAIESHLSKYRSLIPSLALIMHLVDGKKGNIDVDTLLRAIAFSEYLESHAKRVYGAGMRSDVEGAKSIIERLEKGDLIDGFTMRDVYKKDWKHLTQWQSVRDALDILVEYRWLREEAVRGQGRPTTRYYRRF
jgi:Protein of unknown function (DUF3987)/Bifunctional DNA primase/polymerase, N-terminal